MTEHSAVSFQAVDDATIAVVELSELDSAVTDALLADLGRRVGSGEGIKLILDLSRVKFMDSVAMGGMVVLLRRVKQAEGHLALAGLSGHCLNVMQVTGLEKVFDLYPSVQAAVEGLRRPV